MKTKLIEQFYFFIKNKKIIYQITLFLIIKLTLNEIYFKLYTSRANAKNYLFNSKFSFICSEWKRKIWCGKDIWNWAVCTADNNLHWRHEFLTLRSTRWHNAHIKITFFIKFYDCHNYKIKCTKLQKYSMTSNKSNKP